MKLVVDLSKATTAVRPHARRGRLVRGHVREIADAAPSTADIGWRCGARPPAGDLKAVERHFMDRVPGLTLELSGKPDPDAYGRTIVHLDLIQVAEKKQGIGTKVMEDLVRWADHNGKTLTLSVADRNDDLGTTSGARLHRFYKRFGFVDNKGRRKDYSLSMYVNMYREPEKVAGKASVQVAPHVRGGSLVRGYARISPTPRALKDERGADIAIGHRGWISPDGENYGFPIGLPHGAAARDYLKIAAPSYEGETEWLQPLRVGWVRQASPDTYTVPDRSHVDRVIDYVKERYPHVGTVFIELATDEITPGGGFSGKVLDFCTKHRRSEPCRLCAAGKSTVPVKSHVRAGHPVAPHVRQVRDAQPVPVVRSAGWLAPDGAAYSNIVDGSHQSHFEWAHQQGLVRDLDGSLPKADKLAPYEVANLELILQGWVRQASRVAYELRREDRQRVVDYVRKHHGNNENVLLDEWVATDQPEEGDVYAFGHKRVSMALCPKHARVTAYGQGCRMCLAGKSTVHVSPHMRDGHPVRGHVRVLKRRADTKPMGRNLHRWSKPKEEWTAEEHERAARVQASIEREMERSGMPGQSPFSVIEDLSGVVVTKAELPPVLYHVTAHAAAIAEDMTIRVTDSMEKGGLGGSHLATHFCRDRAQAEMIRRELLRAGQIARGEVGPEVFTMWAREDEQLGGVPAGTLDAAVAETRRTYEVYANDPSRHLRFSEWEGFNSTPSEAAIATAKPHPSVPDVLIFPDGSMGGWRSPGEWGWQMGPLAKPWAILNDAYDLYLNMRSSAAYGHFRGKESILDNPLLLGNSKAFEIATPESIAIIEVPTANIPDDALITRPNVNFNSDGAERNDFLTEVRVYADVPTDGARFAAKGIEHVKPHQRNGKPVRGYIRVGGQRRPIALHPDDLATQEMLSDTGRWDLAAAEDGDSYYWGKTFPDLLVTVKPPAPPEVLPVPARPGRRHDLRYFYDSRIADASPATGDERSRVTLRPESGYVDRIEKVATPNPSLLYRGMSWEEMQSVLSTGHVRSAGEYNMGEAQEGLTFFSTSPDQADSYAGGFAPYTRKPTWERPSYVIAVEMPEAGRLHYLNGRGEMQRTPPPGGERMEVGVEGAVPVASIRHVYEVRPYLMDVGEFQFKPDSGIQREVDELTPEGGEPIYKQGSGSHAGGAYAYREISLPAAKGARRVRTHMRRGKLVREHVRVYHGTSSEEADAVRSGGLRAEGYAYLTDPGKARDWAQMRVDNRAWRKLPPGRPTVLAATVDKEHLVETYGELYRYARHIPGDALSDHDAEKAVVTKPQLPFAKPAAAERKNVQKPGSRGATEWWIDKNGRVMYGPRPAPEAEARWDERPDATAFSQRIAEAATVASPEDRENLSFESVYERHADAAHRAFLMEAERIDNDAGLAGRSEIAIGDTTEWGTEPSLVTTYQDVPDYETLRYVAAKRGLYSKSPQKAVIAWQRDEGGGQDHLYSVRVKAPASELRGALDEAGLPYRTFVEHEDGSTSVYVFQVAGQAEQGDIERQLVIFADGYGGPDVERQAGRAEFIGADDREEAGRIYREIIDRYEAKQGRGRAARPPEGDGGDGSTGGAPPVRKGLRLVLDVARRAFKSFWERKPVQQPGSRGATRNESPHWRSSRALVSSRRHRRSKVRRQAGPARPSGRGDAERAHLGHAALSGGAEGHDRGPVGRQPDAG